jgi:RNA 3'-terminal phosphate cyclase (ATP)/RNA 3'-terminal phosphate cyclase (GTP)
MLIYCALAQSPSCFLARTLSSHAQTTLWLLPQFLPLRVSTRPVSGCTRVDVAPG